MGDLLAPGRGRQPGQRNKHTLTLQEITQRAVKGGLTPLEYMLQVLRRPDVKKRLDETEDAFALRYHNDTQQRLDAARIAAPYIHSKVATTVNLEGGENIGANQQSVDVRELARDICFALMLADRRPGMVIDMPAAVLNDRET